MPASPAQFFRVLFVLLIAAVVATVMVIPGDAWADDEIVPTAGIDDPSIPIASPIPPAILDQIGVPTPTIPLEPPPNLEPTPSPDASSTPPPLASIDDAVAPITEPVAPLAPLTPVTNDAPAPSTAPALDEGPAGVGGDVVGPGNDDSAVPASPRTSPATTPQFKGVVRPRHIPSADVTEQSPSEMGPAGVYSGATDTSRVVPAFSPLRELVESSDSPQLEREDSEALPPYLAPLDQELASSVRSAHITPSRGDVAPLDRPSISPAIKTIGAASILMVVILSLGLYFLVQSRLGASDRKLIEAPLRRKQPINFR